MSGRSFRFCSASSVLLVLPLLLAGCSSGGGQGVSCGAPADPCPVNPGPAFLYATNNRSGEILAFNMDRKTGALGAPTTFPGATLGSGIASAQNRFLYVSDNQNAAVDAFAINQTSGALSAVPGSPFTLGGNPPLDPLWLVAGTDLYATSVSGTSGFTIASNGALTPVAGSPFSGGASGQAVLGQSKTTPINYFLYATNLTDPHGKISAFKLDPASGVLTTIPGNFTTGHLAGPDGIVFDGTLGPFVFVALNNADAIAAFSVDPASGALTAVPGSPFDSGISPVYLALSAAQDFLYAMNFSDSSISAYAIASNGALTQVPGSPFVLPDTPGDIAVSGDNFLYATLPLANGILGFSIGANGALSPLAGSPFSASGPALLTTVQIPPP